MAKRTVTGAQTLSVSTPDELDRLLEALARARGAAAVGAHEGEHLFATERVVVSPAAGVFHPAADVEIGRAVAAGRRARLGRRHEVRSPFAGTIMGMLTVDGERVGSREPIAWLRVA